MLVNEWFMDPSIWTRVFLAIFLGGLIGLEREIHGRPAGLRTHVMVCLGSASLILASEFTQESVEAGGVVFNPDRVAAGIITGIGFLGAGAIMREENMVRGLTTAGCIWFVAGLGIVIGKSFYSLAVVITLAALVVLILFRYVELWVPILDFKEIDILVTVSNYEDVRKQCLDIFRVNNITVEDKKLTIDIPQDEVEMRYIIRLKKDRAREDMIREISKIPGVKKIVW